MVRPEGAHSKQSQKADLTLWPGLPQRIGGFGASCKFETRLLLRHAKIERDSRGDGSHRTCGHLGYWVWDGVAARIVSQKKAPPEKSQMLVGEGKSEIPAGWFQLCGKQRDTKLYWV